MIYQFAIDCATATYDCSGLPRTAATPDALTTILNIAFGITASIALLIIVIGGFRYIVAHGDPNGVAQAKKAILYAIIGLMVSLAAIAIVSFVIKGVS